MGWATVAPLAASDQGSSLQPSESAPLSIPNTSQILYPLHARSASPQKQDTKQKPGSIVNLAASPAQILQQRTASSTSSVSPSAQSQRFNLPNLGDELDTPLVASGASSSAKAAQRSAPPPPANVDSPRTYSPPETRDMAACFQTDFSPRNLSGISSPLPRNVAHVAHETDFSSRRGTTPHSTQFSTRSSAPPSAAESVAGTPIDATDLEILRGAWVKTWGEAYTQLLVLQNQESNGIFARDRSSLFSCPSITAKQAFIMHTLN